MAIVVIKRNKFTATERPVMARMVTAAYGAGHRTALNGLFAVTSNEITCCVCQTN